MRRKKPQEILAIQRRARRRIDPRSARFNSSELSDLSEMNPVAPRSKVWTTHGVCSNRSIGKLRNRHIDLNRNYPASPRRVRAIWDSIIITVIIIIVSTDSVGRSNVTESRIGAARKTISRASVTRGNVRGAGRASFSQRHRDFLCIRRGFFPAYSYRSRRRGQECP